MRNKKTVPAALSFFVVVRNCIKSDKLRIFLIILIFNYLRYRKLTKCKFSDKSVESA